KSWFKTQMIKAKQFEPVNIFNKLKGKDIFESNNTLFGPASVSTPLSSSPVPARSITQTPTKAPAAPTPTIIDPDDLVTKKHWQRSSGRDQCSDPACGKPLNVTNGSINCRQCGRLFCDEHTRYEIKLSRDAKHDPVRGNWQRVCETCFKSREGYNDHNG